MKAAFDKFMRRNPFIASLALFLVCNISLCIFCAFLIFAAAPLLDMAGLSVDGVGVPIGGIIIGFGIVAAAGLCDVYYAVKAESRLGYLIWFLGIPLFWVLISVTPESYLTGGNVWNTVKVMYCCRWLLFSLVRAYSYLAKDEKRKRAAQKNLMRDHSL